MIHPWLIGSIYTLGVLICLFLLGYSKEGGDPAMAFVWPLILVGIPFLPFIGVHFLGQHLRDRKIAKEELKNNPIKQFDKDLNNLIQEK